MTDDYAVARRRMLDTLIERQLDCWQTVLDERVLEVMGVIPRHCFVPTRYSHRAYEDTPLHIGQGQTISQPFIVAFMTSLLCPQSNHTVLELGTGSGYQTAVLARLVARVYSIERIPSLAQQARERLQQLGIDNVEISINDGYYGWQAHAPFDSIIVTAAAPQVPKALLNQLKANGRLVIPVGLPHRRQELQLVCKDIRGMITSQSLLPVAFVPLVEDGIASNPSTIKGDNAL